MSEDKYSSQKKHLATKKQLRVWVDPAEYDAFKAKCEQNGESIYSAVNRFIREYTAKPSPEKE